jgi:hypothetical protein
VQCAACQNAACMQHAMCSVCAVCNVSERSMLHAHVMELRIKQMLAHVINQLTCFATGWKCVPSFESNSLLPPDQVRSVCFFKILRVLLGLQCHMACVDLMGACR